MLKEFTILTFLVREQVKIKDTIFVWVERIGRENKSKVG